MLDDLIYYGMHKLLGQEPVGQVIIVIAYTLIGTTVAGTFVYLMLDSALVERRGHKKRDMFPTRRQTRRRNPIRFTK